MAAAKVSGKEQKNSNRDEQDVCICLILSILCIPVKTGYVWPCREGP